MTVAVLTRRPATRLSRGPAFALQAIILTTFFAAASAPTPLYGLYQLRWHFSSVTLTLIFAAYAVALLGALLVVGTLSDHLGRRPVLLSALVLEAAAMLVFAYADGVNTLLVARVVQGLATGSAMGVLGAGLLELEHPDVPGRGALINSVAPMFGLALGGIASSAIVEWLVSPTRTVYLILLVALAIQAFGVLVAPETSMRRTGTLASLRPRVGLPSTARTAILIGTPAAVACWALGGLYLSLGPAVARSITGWTTPLLGGVVVLVLAGSGAAVVFLLRRTDGRSTMFIGTIALVVGMISTLWSIQASSAALFFAGAVIAGAGFGAGFSGVMRIVIPLVRPDERAELLATMYVISYLAFSLPAVVAGLFVVHVGLLPTVRVYALVVLVLAAVAGVGLRLSARPKH